jgi:hypothetical protein
MSIVHTVLISCAAASDDEHSVCHSTSVLPANGMDRHTACKMAWSPLVSGVDRAH